MLRFFPDMNPVNATPESSRTGFSLTELLVSVAIMGLLAALVFPAFSRAVAKSRDTVCQSNLHQIGAALALYQADNEQALPSAYNTSTGYYWFHYLLGQVTGTSKYMPSTTVLSCPAHTGTASTAYGVTPPTRVSYAMTDLVVWSPAVHRMSTESRFFLHSPSPPSKWPLVMDADTWALYNLENPIASAAKDSRFTARHLEWANVLMADGHLERIQYGDKRWNQSSLNP